METLPIELIEKILVDDSLNVQDAINLSLTCKQLQEIIRNNNTIWKTKFYQIYPHLKNKLQDLPESYYDELNHLYKLKKRMKSMLEKMPEKFYKKLELSNQDLIEWDNLIRQKFNNYFYLAEDLLYLANRVSNIDSEDVVPFDTPGNMTQKYYATKVLRFIRPIYLERMWRRYIRKPSEECLLEEGAIIMAQWSQSNIRLEHEEISKKLDLIANMVKKQIKIDYPNSPLLRVSNEELKVWKTAKKPDNNWSLNDRCNIFKTIGNVLFLRLGFQESSQFQMDYNDFFINEALKRGRAKLQVLAIIYEAVARRLGVRCEITVFPSHFLLRFPASEYPVPIYYYINISNKGQISKGSGCPFQHARNQNQPTASPVDVIVTLANNLYNFTKAAMMHRYITPSDNVMLRSTLEFLHVINPNDLRNLLDLSAFYMQYNFENSVLRGLLTYADSGTVQGRVLFERIRDYRPETHDKLMEPVKRPSNNRVEFAVGMVMLHKIFHYKCVIFNWDKECMASNEWKSNNQISTLKYGDKQPFYNVLGEDYSHRYVAQENIIPCYEPDGLLANDEYGRYFSHYNKTHYVPNTTTEKLFPEDGLVRRRFQINLLEKNK